MSGMEKGITLGTPIAMMVMNENVKKADYTSFSDIPRPGHADYTYLKKYGCKASSGGGRSSARETIARVASGAIAEMWLKESFSTNIICYVSSIGEVSIPEKY